MRITKTESNKFELTKESVDKFMKIITDEIPGMPFPKLPEKIEGCKSLFQTLNSGMIPETEAAIDLYAFASRRNGVYNSGYYYVDPQGCRKMTEEEKEQWEKIKQERNGKANSTRVEKPVKEKVACFTGRRPKDLCGYDHDAYKPFMKEFIRELEHLYETGVRKFISGGAQGFDQLAFWGVEHLKVKHPEVQNIVYVPFEGIEDPWRDKGCFSKDEYHKMLRAADQTVILSAPSDESLVDHFSDYYLKRNQKMVNDADIVVALYPKHDFSSQKSGTAATLRYAQKNKKPIYQLFYNIKETKLLFDHAELIDPILKDTQKKKRNDIRFDDLVDKKIICFDTETTGLSKTDEIIQLSIVGLEDGEEKVLYSEYFKPRYHTSWAEAEAKNHISPAMVANKPYMSDCIEEFKDIFENADIIAGYNVAYDVRLLAQSIGQGKIDLPEEKIHDVRSYFAKTEEGHHTLTDAVKRYCPERLNWFEDHAHDALADTLATLYVLESQAKENGVDLCPEKESRGEIG